MDYKARQSLLQRWLHSHEEDTETESMYRPSNFPFPPSRGRTGFELKPDHTGTYIGIAATDGTAEKQCRWELKENEEIVLLLTFESGDFLSLQVSSVDSEQLAICK